MAAAARLQLFGGVPLKHCLRLSNHHHKMAAMLYMKGDLLTKTRMAGLREWRRGFAPSPSPSVLQQSQQKLPQEEVLQSQATNLRSHLLRPNLNFRRSLSRSSSHRQSQISSSPGSRCRQSGRLPPLLRQSFSSGRLRPQPHGISTSDLETVLARFEPYGVPPPQPPNASSAPAPTYSALAPASSAPAPTSTPGSIDGNLCEGFLLRSSCCEGYRATFALCVFRSATAQTCLLLAQTLHQVVVIAPRSSGGCGKFKGGRPSQPASVRGSFLGLAPRPSKPPRNSPNGSSRI
ncbi:hypothetical protein AKJ16_DCAP23380, partial [Drosera capensis]